MTVSLVGFHGVHVPDPPPPLSHSQLSVGTVDIHQISQSLESTGCKEGVIPVSVTHADGMERWKGLLGRREAAASSQWPSLPFPGKERSLALERRPIQDPAALQSPSREHRHKRRERIYFVASSRRLQHLRDINVGL